MPNFNAKSFEVALLLINEGFIMINNFDESGWNLQYPDNMSAQKAKQIISACINIHKYEKDIENATNKYNHYIKLLNDIKT